MTDNDERLKKLEGQFQGIRNGQSELRNHIDNRIDALTKIVEDSNSEKPISGPVWAFILLALSAVLGTMVDIVLLVDYYFLR